MSTHLSHLINWHSIANCYYFYTKPSEISLPVGPCGQIHLLDRGVQIQVEQRKGYISEAMVCSLPECNKKFNDRIKEAKEKGKEFKISYEKFSKPKRKKRLTFPSIISFEDNYKNLLSFFRSFVNALFSFVEQEKKFVSLEGIKSLKEPPSEEYIRGSIREILNKDDDYSQESIIYCLLAKNDLASLAYLDHKGLINIDEEFSRDFSSQFMPKLYKNILKNCMQQYFQINVLIKLGFDGELSKKESEILFKAYQENFQRVPHNRSIFDCYEMYLPLWPYFRKEVLFVDLDKTKFLLKALFRHMVSYYTMKWYISVKDFEDLVAVDKLLREEILENAYGYIFMNCLSPESVYEKLTEEII